MRTYAPGVCIGPDASDERTLRRRAAEAWHMRRYLGCYLDEPRLSPAERHFLEQIGIKLYGERPQQSGAR